MAWPEALGQQPCHREGGGTSGVRSVPVSPDLPSPSPGGGHRPGRGPERVGVLPHAGGHASWTRHQQQQRRGWSPPLELDRAAHRRAPAMQWWPAMQARPPRAPPAHSPFKVRVRHASCCAECMHGPRAMPSRLGASMPTTAVHCPGSADCLANGHPLQLEPFFDIALHVSTSSNMPAGPLSYLVTDCRVPEPRSSDLDTLLRSPNS